MLAIIRTVSKVLILISIQLSQDIIPMKNFLINIIHFLQNYYHLVEP